jgi:MFS superfamily sulfate permease-like transporter
MTEAKGKSYQQSVRKDYGTKVESESPLRVAVIQLLKDTIMFENILDSLNDKPENGLKGLRHWRYDLLAGLQVSLVSLPLSLGIAIASGAPPITGLISAIIAGLVYPLLGGSYVTISGPAAGLAPALLAGMLTLGNGDLAAGYPLLLVAICLTGVVQLFLTVFKVGEFAKMMPIAVMEGMLAAIGLMIIIKQIPALLGDLATPSKSILLALGNIPNSFVAMEYDIFFIGASSLVLVFFLNKNKVGWLGFIPAPLVVVCVGIVLGYLFQVDPKYLIKIPDNLTEDGFTLPDFARVWNDPNLWSGVIVVVVTLTLIDGIESLATVAAVDKIDPFQRRSDPNKTLRAMAVSNILSSIAGGLTIIPGGIKSRANIDAGGRTLWANAYNAVFLIIFLWVGKDLINSIPLATLAAVLIYVGWRLCEPRGWIKALAIGKEQFFLFSVTVISVLTIDLLFGILIGIFTKALLLFYLQMPSFRYILTGRISLRQLPNVLRGILRGLFANPVIRHQVFREDGKEEHSVYLSSSFCFNLLKLEKTLSDIPRYADVNLVMTLSARMVDHTAMEHLHYFQEQCVQDGRKCQIRGLESFHRFSNHPLSAGLRDGRRHRQQGQISARPQSLLEVAKRYGLRFSPSIVSSLNEHKFIYLARGSEKEESNIITGPYKRCEIKIFDYRFTDMPQYFRDTRHTMIVIEVNHPAGRIPNCVLEPDHYGGKYLAEYRDVHLADALHFPRKYHLRGEDEERVRDFFASDLIRFFEAHPQFYMEARDNHILAFRVDRDLEDVDSIRVLFSFADIISRICVPDVELTA